MLSLSTITEHVGVAHDLVGLSIFMITLSVHVTFSIRVWTACCKKRPKTPNATLLGKVRGMTDEEKAKKERETKEVLSNSILNHQTNSIRQVGAMFRHTITLLCVPSFVCCSPEGVLSAMQLRFSG